MERGHTGQKKNKAQDTEKHPHLNRQVKTIARTHTSKTIRTGTPFVLEITHALLPSDSDRGDQGVAGCA